MDVSEMQRKLSQWATENPTEQRRELYNLLCEEIWLRVAHHSVNSNQGRETAGVDSQSMSNFNGDLEGNLRLLRDQLITKTFEPQPVRRVMIPKPSGGLRKLGVPAAVDRLICQAIAQVLTPVFDPLFIPIASGFAPGVRSIRLSSGHASSSPMTRRGASILISTRFSIAFSTTL